MTALEKQQKALLLQALRVLDGRQHGMHLPPNASHSSLLSSLQTCLLKHRSTRRSRLLDI
jgi:hypothetical protein